MNETNQDGDQTYVPTGIHWQVAQATAATHPLVDLGRNLLLLIPFRDVRFDLGLDPLADLSPEVAPENQP